MCVPSWNEVSDGHNADRRRADGQNIGDIFFQKLVHLLDGFPKEFDLVVDDLFRFGRGGRRRDDVFVDVDVLINAGDVDIDNGLVVVDVFIAGLRLIDVFVIRLRLIDVFVTALRLINVFVAGASRVGRFNRFVFFVDDSCVVDVSDVLVS